MIESVLLFMNNFWLDFFAAYHKRLMKNAKYETPISTLLHLSFIQAINFNTIFVLILHFVFRMELNFIILFSPIVVIALINCYNFYYKKKNQLREDILNRHPKYKIWIYDLYFLFSALLLFPLVLYIISKNR